MSITIAWKVTSLDRLASTGEVTVVHWEANASDGEHSARVYGCQSLGKADVDAPWYIPFEDITEAKALEWAWETLDKHGIEDALRENLEMLINPETLKGTPW